MMVLSLQGIQFLVQLLTFMGQKRATGSPACIRTKDPTNRVEVCQTTSSAKLDNSERPLPVWTHSLSYHSQFSSKVSWDTFLSLCFSSIMKISLVSCQHRGMRSRATSYLKEKKKNCAHVQHFISYQDDDDNNYHFQKPLMCHMIYRQYLQTSNYL